ncbi:MAG: VTT domain-containing protein [Proteobacteria bacterium]|nr:VTT domain-containing protein [Pseudomonadota bacterium]
MAILKILAYKKKLIFLLLLITIIFIVFLFNKFWTISPEIIFTFIQNNKILAPFLFIVFYIIMSISVLPTLPMNLGAGLLWGPLWGTLLSVIGATCGASCSFIIARYLVHDYCKRKLQNPKWLRLFNAIEGNGWKVVAFVRLDPIFASGPLNYLFGITPIPFGTFIWSTALFLIPPASIIASIGYFIGWSVLSEESIKDVGHYIVLAGTLVTIVLIILFFIIKYFRESIKL